MQKSMYFIGVGCFLLLAFGAFISHSAEENKECKKQFAVKPESLAERKRLGEKSLGKSLSEKQMTALEGAHRVGLGQKGEDGTPARIGNYTKAQKNQKYRILRQAGFSQEEAKKLMKDGVVGIYGNSPGDWDTQQHLVSDVKFIFHFHDEETKILENLNPEVLRELKGIRSWEPPDSESVHNTSRPIRHYKLSEKQREALHILLDELKKIDAKKVGSDYSSDLAGKNRLEESIDRIEEFLGYAWIPHKSVREAVEYFLEAKTIQSPKEVQFLPPHTISLLSRESTYSLKFKHIKRLTPEQVNALNAYDINPKAFEKIIQSDMKHHLNKRGKMRMLKILLDTNREEITPELISEVTRMGVVYEVILLKHLKELTTEQKRGISIAGVTDDVTRELMTDYQNLSEEQKKALANILLDQNGRWVHISETPGTFTSHGQRMSGRYDDKLGPEETRDRVISQLIGEGFIEERHVMSLKPPEIQSLNMEALSREAQRKLIRNSAEHLKPEQVTSLLTDKNFVENLDSLGSDWDSSLLLIRHYDTITKLPDEMVTALVSEMDPSSFPYEKLPTLSRYMSPKAVKKVIESNASEALDLTQLPESTLQSIPSKDLFRTFWKRYLERKPPENMRFSGSYYEYQDAFFHSSITREHLDKIIQVYKRMSPEQKETVDKITVSGTPFQDFFEKHLKEHGISPETVLGSL